MGQTFLQERINAVVTFRCDLSPGLMTLRVAPVNWVFPDFNPGQYVSLGLFGSWERTQLAEPEVHAALPERLIRRPYSIASPPENREFLEFYINLVPNGALTPRLFTLVAGDPVHVGSKVAGSFTLRSIPEDANVILIATGTGLAPYASILRSSQSFRQRRRIALIHGVRNSPDLGYRSMFTALQCEKAFTYVPVVSRPRIEIRPWTGAAGHVQDVWKSGVLERAWGFRPNPDNSHVLLCGNPVMIESMIAILAAQGFRPQTARMPGEVHCEKYWTTITYDKPHSS